MWNKGTYLWREIEEQKSYRGIKQGYGLVKPIRQFAQHSSTILSWCLFYQLSDINLNNNLINYSIGKHMESLELGIEWIFSARPNRPCLVFHCHSPIPADTEMGRLSDLNRGKWYIMFYFKIDFSIKEKKSYCYYIVFSLEFRDIVETDPSVHRAALTSSDPIH